MCRNRAWLSKSLLFNLHSSFTPAATRCLFLSRHALFIHWSEHDTVFRSQLRLWFVFVVKCIGTVFHASVFVWCHRSWRGAPDWPTEKRAPWKENTEWVLSFCALFIVHNSEHKSHCSISSQDECHNFIKVLVPRNDDLVFICGTNGFNPMCRYYRVGHRVYKSYVSVVLSFPVTHVARPCVVSNCLS